MPEVIFNDHSVMPYGQHKGKTMANVPAPYLLVLLDKDMFSAVNGPAVKAYILRNLDDLKKEAKNAQR